MKPSDEILFMPLGGGQRVGASCYYLRIGGNSIILDAGAGQMNGAQCSPVFSELMTLPEFWSLNQIAQIYVSHAHADHTGFLTGLMNEAQKASVYMTEITKSLSELQIYDRIFFGNGNPDQEQKRFGVRNCLDRITTVSFMQNLYFSDYRVSFYPAGHIPGAMMTMFETGDRKILYTGDWSVDSTSLCSGYYLPDNSNIDTVIMCGLHARHSGYRKSNDDIFESIYGMIKYAERKAGSVMCTTCQLSKGVELLKMINENNRSHVPVYIDKKILQVVSKLEKSGIRIMTGDNRMMNGPPPDTPHIFLAGEGSLFKKCYEKRINLDFSLHEDFHQMKKFIERINPKKVILVHCDSREQRETDYTIEQEILSECRCRTQFIFAEEQHLYYI